MDSVLLFAIFLGQLVYDQRQSANTSSLPFDYTFGMDSVLLFANEVTDEVTISSLKPRPSSSFSSLAVRKQRKAG